MERQTETTNKAITVNQAQNVNQAQSVNQANAVNQAPNIQDALVIDEANVVDEAPKKKKKDKKKRKPIDTYAIDLSAQDMIEAIVAAMGEGIGWGTGKVFEAADYAINGRFGLADQVVNAAKVAKAIKRSVDKKREENKSKDGKEGGTIYNPSEKELQASKDPVDDLKSRTGEYKEALSKVAKGKELSESEKGIMAVLSDRCAAASRKEAKSNPEASKAYSNLSKAFGKAYEGKPLEKEETKIIAGYAKDFSGRSDEVTKKIEKEVSSDKGKEISLKEAPDKQKIVDAKIKEAKREIKQNKGKKKEVKKDIKDNLNRRVDLQQMSGRKISKAKTATRTPTKTQTKDMSLIKNKAQKGR